MKRCIAIDAMGGDNAPEEIVKGLADFENSGFSFLIFGVKDQLLRLVGQYLSKDFPCDVIDSPDIVTSDMQVVKALHITETSSMGMAIHAVKNGDADAVVSAGNTGAYMAAAKVILKTLNGIDRPAISTTIPGDNGKSVMLDLGANSECSLRNMVEFAVMGKALAKAVLKKANPSVSLLNIGSENIKGHPLVRNASEIIGKLCQNYVGYVEGNDIVRGVVDVIVTDGFSGNIALKSIEGTARLLLSNLKGLFKANLRTKMAAALMMPSLKTMTKKYDPRIHNGAI